MFIARKGALATFILKRSPLSAGEVASLEQTVERLQFELVHAPGRTPLDNPYAQFASAPDPDAFIRDHDGDIGASTDDRPFFFYARQPLSDLFAVKLDRSLLFGTGADALRTLLVLSVLLVAVFIVLPLAWLSPEPLGHVGRSLAPLGYFACLGAGFMMVEMGFLQRFVLFLGHPVYSLSVILFSLLLGGGLGSAVSRRFGTSPGRALAVALPAVIVAGVAYSLWVPSLFDAWIPLARPVRIVLAILLLLPMGVLLGVPLPSGVRLLGQRRPGLLAWAWGINGAMSVLGASCAVLVAMNWGFSAVALTGAAVYAVAGALATIMGRQTAAD